MADSADAVFTNERMVTLSGPSVAHLVQAVRLVTTTFHVDGDPSARLYTNTTTIYPKGRTAGQVRDATRDSYASSRYGADYSQPYDQYSSSRAVPSPRFNGPGLPYYGLDYREPQEYGYDRDYPRSVEPIRNSMYRYQDDGRGIRAQYREPEPTYRDYRDPYMDSYRDSYRAPYRDMYGSHEGYARDVRPPPPDPYYDYRGPMSPLPYAASPYSAPIQHNLKDPDQQRMSVHIPSEAEIAASSAVAFEKGVTVGSPYVGEGGNIVVVIGVPDSIMGLVLGRRGVVIQEIKVISKAQIHVSQKNVHLPGTSNRSMTISGTEKQVQNAQAMIVHQLGST